MKMMRRFLIPALFVAAMTPALAAENALPLIEPAPMNLTQPAPAPQAATPAAAETTAPASAAAAIEPAPVVATPPAPVAAATPAKPAVRTIKMAPGMQLKDLPEVKAVQDYLQNLKTLKARFIQTSNDGRQVAGDFMLKRPGRMRFEYDHPIKDFIVADGLMIYYYDGEMKEQKNTLISQSLADFFLRENVRFSGDVKISDVKRADGLLMITLVQTKDPLAGSLILGISEKPSIQLKKWRVVDAQGMTTEVELFDAASGIALDNSKFHYYDPDHKKQRFN